MGGLCRLSSQAIMIESDADEQLLLTISFTSKVKLHSISVGGPSDGRAPKTVRLFANRQNLGFADVEDMPAEQELELAPETLGERLELRFVKFQSVERLTVFIQSNQGDEESSALASLRLWGTNVSTTDMKEFKRVSGRVGEGD